MPGKLFISAIVCVALGAAGEPPLTTGQKLEIREAQVSALQSSQALAEFLPRVQAQLEAMPEYRKLKLGGDAAASSLANAVQRAVAGCEACQLDIKTLALVRRDPRPAP